MLPLISILAALPALAAQPAAEPFHVEQLGAGVYAIIRHDPTAFANNANSLVVIGDSGVLVVDAQYTQKATRQTIAAIRKLTALPVRFVVNTHWHDDHVAGNQVYRDTFPDVLFVSHENTRRDLATVGAENRKGTVEVAPSYTARLARLMRAGLGWDSTAIVPNERLALESTISITRDYLADAPTFRETLADLTFTSKLEIHLGRRTVEVRYFGRANTAGDAVVIVPDQRVVATGDLVVHPVPFAFNSYISEWIPALDALMALHAAAYVPGHGPVLRDTLYIGSVRRMLARVRDETRAAVARGDSLGQARKQITLADERDRVAGSDKWLRLLFRVFFLDPAVERAFAEARKR
jgi:cyclase